MQSHKWYYKFNAEPNKPVIVWSGVINISQPVNRDLAKRFICRQHGLDRVPSKTIILSHTEWLEQTNKKGATL
jgi:hypothetical protein